MICLKIVRVRAHGEANVHGRSDALRWVRLAFRRFRDTFRAKSFGIRLGLVVMVLLGTKSSEMCRDLAQLCMTYGSETLITRLRPAGHRVVLQCENRLNCKVPKQSSDLVEELRLQEDLAIGDGNHLMSQCRITKQSSAQQLSPSNSYVTSKTPRSDQIEPCRIRGDVGTDIAGLGLDDRQGSERAATVRGLAEMRKQSSSKSSHRNWPRSSWPLAPASDCADRRHHLSAARSVFNQFGPS